MVQNNKILTVSYGAFSCTLEGFDDSLDTMKAVAGYFRDLASEDRHFGAEPLQADADAPARFSDPRISRNGGTQNSDADVVDAASSAGPHSAMNPAITSAPQSIADKLQRIRAVVSQSEDSADNYCEDEPADIFISSAAKDIGHALRHEDDVFYGSAEDPEDEELSHALKQLDGNTQATQKAEETPADHASGVGAAAFAVADSSGLDWPAADPAAFVFDTATVEYADAGTLLDVSDIDPSGENPSAEDVDDSRVPEIDADPASPTMEIADHAGSERLVGEDEAGAIKNVENRDECARDDLSPPEDSQDADLARLMASVETQMNDTQAASSREIHDRMRAAVTDADAADDDPTRTSDTTAYLDDLAKIVQPRRPVATVSGNRTPRPTVEKRLAPLKLVAEQRVDLPHIGAAVGPVHPRRVALASSGSGPAAEGEQFAQFAEEVGASSLPELLEAAAAYLSFVEKRAQFSRPQLINTVRQLEDRSFNREDGLHQFGELLRDGKIAKTDGGCFTASENIGFHPDKRAVG